MKSHDFVIFQLPCKATHHQNLVSVELWWNLELEHKIVSLEWLTQFHQKWVSGWILILVRKRIFFSTCSGMKPTLTQVLVSAFSHPLCFYKPPTKAIIRAEKGEPTVLFSYPHALVCLAQWSLQQSRETDWSLQQRREASLLSHLVPLPQSLISVLILYYFLSGRNKQL